MTTDRDDTGTIGYNPSEDDYLPTGESWPGSESWDEPEQAEPEQAPRMSNRERARARNYRPPYEKPNRKPASEREEAFNALLWLVDGATGIVEEMRHSDLGLSEEFWVHASAAKREGLLTLRALLDQFIEATEDGYSARGEPPTRPEQSTPRTRRGGINVDF